MKPSPPKPPPMREYRSTNPTLDTIAFIVIVLVCGILIGTHIYWGEAYVKKHRKT